MSSYFLVFTLIWLINVSAKNIDMDHAYRGMGDQNDVAVLVNELQDLVEPLEKSLALLDNVSHLKLKEKKYENHSLREMFLRDWSSPTILFKKRSEKWFQNGSKNQLTGGY